MKVDEYNEFCKETYLLVMLVPWIKMSPSSQIVLAHSAELIEGNDHKGLLNFTESGIEAEIKF